MKKITRSILILFILVFLTACGETQYSYNTNTYTETERIDKYNNWLKEQGVETTISYDYMYNPDTNELRDRKDITEAFEDIILTAIKNKDNGQKTKVAIKNIPNTSKEMLDKIRDDMVESLYYSKNKLAMSLIHFRLITNVKTKYNMNTAIIEFIITNNFYTHGEYDEALAKLKELNLQTYEDIINYALDNFQYDYTINPEDKSTNPGHPGLYGAVIKNKAVCDGFAEYLYQACKNINIPVRKISYSFMEENGQEMGHALNEVYLNGEWKLVDLTQAISDPEKRQYAFTGKLYGKEAIINDPDTLRYKIVE